MADDTQRQTPYIAQLAQQAGTTATQGLLGGIFGQIFAKSNDRRQLRQQEKLQDLQIKGQEQLTDYNYGKQLQMWKDTSYGAQMEQLQKAGLNPGLIYGMGGAGGQSNNIQQGQVTGGHAEQNPGEVQQFAGMALQSGLMAAQMRLIDAQARKTEAEIPNQPIIGKNIETQTASLTQGIENQKAVAELTKAQTIMQNLENSIKSNTQTEQEDFIIAQTALAQEHVMQAAIQTNMDRATQNNKIDILAAEAIGALIRNQATLKNIQLQDAEINKMSQDIAQGWTALRRQERELKLSNWVQEQEKSNPSVWNVIGGAIKSGAHKLAELLGQKQDNRAFEPPK